MSVDRNESLILEKVLIFEKPLILEKILGQVNHNVISLV